MTNWRDRFLDLAAMVATWSKDTTKVGAVAVDSSRKILGTGYNGLPRGVADDPARLERPTKYWVTAHAEQNLVANAARSVLAGSTVYVTHPCCSACAGALINAGVSTVVTRNGKTSMDPDTFAWAKTMFQEAGVEFLVIDD
jgi:dCMP deaminase